MRISDFMPTAAEAGAVAPQLRPDLLLGTVRELSGKPRPGWTYRSVRRQHSKAVYRDWRKRP